MSKYEPLKNFLTRSKRAVVELSFREIERIIDARLPASATAHRAFWSNSPDGHAHAKAWLEAGYETDEVDIARKRVLFRRERTPVADLDAAELRKLGRQRLAAVQRALAGTVHIPEGVDIMEPVELTWDAETTSFAMKD